MKPRIAIIGAGISGLTLAKHLSHGAQVVVFEKARGVGGRMSTRNAAPFSFDHGAQFFTARSDAFKQFLAPYLASGRVQEWTGKMMTLEPGKKPTDRVWFEPHYVAVPTMNSLCKALVDPITVTLNCDIVPIQNKTKHGWQLLDKNNHAYGPFDWVISTAPAPQTCVLFENIVPPSVFSAYNYRACYALMLGFQSPWDQSWIAAKIINSPLDWIAVNSSKPHRDKTVTSLVIHTSHLWTESHLNEDRAEIELFLRNELKTRLNLNRGDPRYSALHFWRYALMNQTPEERNQAPYFLDQERQLASVGDWCHRSRIEDTWLNAKELAIKMLL